MSMFTALKTLDVRFPTSKTLDGSDAMNLDPDYSAAYVVLTTDADDGLEGHGFVFTIGRGNDVVVAAIKSLEPYIVGRDVESMLNDMGGTSRVLINDSQLRWLGPEKGVEHMAIGAVLTALWDLRAKRADKPLWKVLSTMSPEELVSCVDFRYLSNALTPDDALTILRRSEPGRAERIARLEEGGFPAYTTTPGWLGYDDEKLARLSREAVDEGFTQIKLKVGADPEEDRRRMRIAREVVGPDIRIAVDANQRWEVDDAVRNIEKLREFDLAWVEEPTSPDDILGHAEIARRISPIPVATGEHMANRIMAKQFMLADALSILQIDATRVASVNENLAMVLLAAKFGKRVCPHAGGVGLCEVVQHMSMFDYVAVSGTTDGRCIEYVDHLHEHFVTPTVIEKGRYRAPLTPGCGSQMLVSSLTEYTYRG